MKKELSSGEIAKRMDSALKRSLTMPPQPQKKIPKKTPPDSKGGASKSKA